MSAEGERTFRQGMRDGVGFALVSALIGASFGVVGAQVFGVTGATVMSFVVFAGASQFGATAVLAAGGSAGAAILAGTLLNLRYLTMGIALAPSLRGRAHRRALAGQGVVDASWALAGRPDGRFDVAYMLGATAVSYPAWGLGTLAGALGGGSIGNPETLGVDALFPAFFLALLWGEARGRAAVVAGGAAIALALVPLTPPGVPILASCLAAVVVGLRRFR